MSHTQLIGILLFIGLLVWISIGLLVPIGYHPAPAVLDLGNAFEGNLALPAEVIAKTFEDAQNEMISVNTWGVWFRRAGDLAAWLSFAVTASITLIAGFYGRSPSPGGAAADTAGLPERKVRLIAFLAALAAVLTAFGNLSVTRSQDYYKRADQVRDLITSSRAEILDEKTTAETAQGILDRLKLEASRTL
jgi:hypothetical protein